MKKVLLASLLGAAMMAPAYSHTTTISEAEVKGPYIGLGVTTSRHEFIPETKYSAKLFGGYDFNRKWGVEGGYVGQADFDQTFAPPGSLHGVHHFNGSGKSFYIGLKATLPISARFALISKFGLAHNRGKVQVTDANAQAFYTETHGKTGAYSSLGVKYLVTPAVALTLEVERMGRPTSARHRNEAISLNVSYSF